MGLRLDGSDLRVVEEVGVGVLAEWGGGGRVALLLWAEERWGDQSAKKMRG